MSLSKNVWKTLSEVDVSDHIEKKGKLSYLSWAWAYGIMMEHYPDIHYTFEEDKCNETGTVEIRCSVLLTEKDQSMVRNMWLPVMDHRNKAISNPDKFAINSSKMRCLTKCFAMFGLGHYIYAGEDLPEAVAKATVNEDQIIAIKKLLDETKSDEKISTLNKLLNRLLGRIVSDNQDCVGSFTKYSECDKSCGSNSYQTRTYI